LYDAYHSPEDARSILEEAEQRIFHIAQESEHASSQTLRDLIDQTMKFLDENEGRAITGVATGFAELDEMTSGLQKGELVIIAARPSMGKTALALNVAEHVALAGKAVAVFSLEMSRQQLVQRLLCSRSGVDSHRLRRNMLRENEWQKLHKACDQLMDAPILIDDTPGLSSMQLRAKARRLASKHKLEMVVIDYLQLMTTGHRTESRQQEVSEISRAVKAMARELEVPVVCLSQLNRAAEQREGHRPRMADLRESGSIEQDADVIMMLHREEYYHQQDPHWAQDNPDKINVAELIIAKQRNGPTGTVNLTWLPMSTRFRDHAMGGDMGYSSEPKPAAGGGPPFGERPYHSAAPAKRSGASAPVPTASPARREPDPAADDIYDPEEDSGIPF
jgi:replicative DNA helicase